MATIREHLLAAYGRAIDYLRGRKRAYQLAFGTPAGEAVLTDLVRFCRGVDTTYSVDARDHARFEGRREVLLRIQQHINLPSEKLYLLYGGRPINQTENDSDLSQ